MKWGVLWNDIHKKLKWIQYKSNINEQKLLFTCKDTHFLDIYFLTNLISLCSRSAFNYKVVG